MARRLYRATDGLRLIRVTPMTISALWSHDGECRTYIHPSNGHPHAGECSGSWSDPEGKAGQATVYFGIPPNRVVELGMQVQL